MSYFLQRLKVAEIARCISDAVPLSPSEATCDTILLLDSKLESLIQELPAFFRLEISDSKEISKLDKPHPYIALQRLVINLIINVVRCKLHFPYFSGHLSKTLHIFSRNAGVKAARRLLSLHQDMATSNHLHSADFMKIQGTVPHMFVGALILATYLCCNKPNEDLDSQSSELMVAVKYLERIMDHVQIACKFLERLMPLLVKYGLWSSSTTSSVLKAGRPTLNANPSACDEMDSQDFGAMLLFNDMWDAFIERPAALDMGSTL